MASVALVGVASMAIGLLVSSVVSTAERAMPLVFLLVMVQVVTTGGIFAIHGKAGIEEIAWLTPSRWGFAANAATIDLNVIGGFNAQHNADPIWNHTAHAWIIDMAAMAALFLFYSGMTWWRLQQARPAQARRLATPSRRQRGRPRRWSWQPRCCPPLSCRIRASGGTGTHRSNGRR